MCPDKGVLDVLFLSAGSLIPPMPTYLLKILEKKALLEIGNNEGTEYDVGDIIGITSEHSAAVKAQMKGVAENQVADIVSFPRTMRTGRRVSGREGLN